MPDIGSAVQGLRMGMGLASDVNTSAASSAPVIASQIPPETPAQQEVNTAQLMTQINQPVPAVPDDVAAKKDKAIDDQREQIQNLQNVVTSQTEKMQQFLDALSQTKEQPMQPEVKLPAIPADLNERPAEEQISILTGVVTDTQKMVQDTFKEEREQLKNFLGPFAYEVQQMSKIKDKNLVQEAFPRYDWEGNLEAFEKRRSVQPGLSAVEAAKLVAPIDQLIEPEPQAPATEAVVPSMEASAGRPAPQPQQNSAEITQRYNTAITDAHRRGNSVQAKQLIDGLLKRRILGS